MEGLKFQEPKHIDRRLIPRWGTIVSFTSPLATVTLKGFNKGEVANIPVSTAIPDSEMTVGRNVQVQVFNPSDPSDGLIVGVYDA